MMWHTNVFGDSQSEHQKIRSVKALFKDHVMMGEGVFPGCHFFDSPHPPPNLQVSKLLGFGSSHIPVHAIACTCIKYLLLARNLSTICVHCCVNIHSLKCTEQTSFV